MVFLKFLLFLFAAYGLLTLIFSIIELMPGKPAYDFGRFKLVLLTRNSQENVEYAVLNIMKSSFLKTLSPGNSLTVVDMGSTDDTVKLLKHMEQYAEGLNVVEFQHREKIFDIISSPEVHG